VKYLCLCSVTRLIVNRKWKCCILEVLASNLGSNSWLPWQVSRGLTYAIECGVYIIPWNRPQHVILRPFSLSECFAFFIVCTTLTNLRIWCCMFKETKFIYCTFVLTVCTFGYWFFLKWCWLLCSGAKKNACLMYAGSC